MEALALGPRLWLPRDIQSSASVSSTSPGSPNRLVIDLLSERRQALITAAVTGE